jgi:isoquinoline 1-oxidoreductase beta subunit
MTPETPTPRRRWQLSRRQFLIGLGSGGALALGAALGLPSVRRTLLQNQIMRQGISAAVPDSPLVWFEITPDNTTHLYLPKAEMGQGIHTALAQIAAEELALDWEQLAVHQADLERGFAPLQMYTFGSNSVYSLYQPIREAAATLREMLRAEAARQLGQPLEQLVAEHSAVQYVQQATARLTYGEIVANRQGEWEVPEAAAELKDAATFRYIGQPIPRVDLPDKVMGRATYGYDVRVPDMLYGVAARPPRYGATLRRALPNAASTMPGVVAVVIEDGFAGVVAERRSAARAALEQMTLEWEGGTTVNQDELEQIVTVPERGGVVIQDEGDLSAGLRQGAPITAAYRTPLAAHATLEPQAAMAEVSPDRITIHASTQAPNVARDFIARAMGRPLETINVQPTYLGASFGRKMAHDVGVEAARLSAAVDRPVHVGWNMNEEIRYGSKRPLTHHVLRGTLDAQGQVTAIEHQLASADAVFSTPELIPGGELTIGLLGAEPGGGLGALILYGAMPNRRTVYHRTPVPVPTSIWRGLGLLPNTFALESFIDELAHAAGADPLAFRLRHLSDDPINQRFRAVLERAVELARWGQAPPAGRARGIACCYLHNTIIAHVAEVSVEGNRIRVHEVTCVADAGLIVNPDGARAQAQGSIMMGLSSTLLERLTVQDGMIEAGNLDQYPLITIADTPSITVDFVQSADHPVGGMGEAAIGPIPAAVANAVFALTGQRLRELPLRLEPVTS